MNAVTHYGFNWTDRGHYMKPRSWIPAAAENLREKLRALVDNERRLCRIWVRYEDGAQRCVYWYEHGQLEI